jgi:ketosteroid isomerase-like protein
MTEFFNKGDFTGIASLYTTDATAFPPGSAMVQGGAPIEALWKSMAEQVSDPKLTTWTSNCSAPPRHARSGSSA